MRTNIDIDDDLMRAAMEAGEFKTKREAVEEGLRLLARRAAYQRLRAARGKLHWSLGGDWTQPRDDAPAALAVQEPRPAYKRRAPAAKGAAPARKSTKR